jgi:chromosome segregation ATPase
MTNPDFENRLDTVEEIAAILVTHVEAIDSRLEQVTQRLDRIAANHEQWEARQQATDGRLDTLTSGLETLTGTVDVLAALMTETTEEMRRRDRQAELDRAEFRTTVQGILDVLTQRFSSNGHAD